MINLTVKTLDSENHAFTVPDEITIAEFKEKIADTVNIPANTQRLIYCGRVLQDSSQLKDYDVDGKVIHLVQRPPPSSLLRPDVPEPQPQPQRRVRGLEYVGTVRLPVGGMENTLHSLPIQSLANSRLNVARRMINRAENVLNALENPNRQEQPPQSEPQEEATPVFEARVVIPTTPAFSGPEGTFSANAPISIVPPQNFLIPEDMESMDPLNGTTTADPLHSVSSTPEAISPLARSTENLATTDAEANNTSEQNEAPAAAAAAAAAVPPPPPPPTSEVSTSTRDSTSTGPTNNQNSSSGNSSRTAEFADILDSLNRLQTRFVPFMEQYNTFMRDDPIVQQENARSTQAMINRVSEVCHYLGHAYHSVSDIIVRVRTPPPRQLLCRPMLIQHSAVVQVDIPIQVEAQINLPSDRNVSSATPTSTASVPSTPATGTTPTTTAGTNLPSESTLNTLLGIPFMPRTGVRVETYRLPILEGNNILRNNNNTSGFRSNLNPPTSDAYVAAIRSLESRARSLSSTITTAAPTTPLSGVPAPVLDVANAIASDVVNSLNNVTSDGTVENTTNTPNTAANAPGDSNNQNVEFFMEVTPESITIDSVETAVLSGNQANELNAILQEGINPSTPEFIQSIMHMAGQLINRSNLSSAIQVSIANTSASSTTTSTPTPSAPPLDVTASTATEASTTTVGAARTTPFQNSQARGNTQTQPTTATQTRSTPRPHVHLAQHTMHAFDPFLPCNSHHVRRRLYNPNNNSAMQQNTSTHNSGTASASQELPINLNDDTSPVYNIIRNLLNSVRNTYSNNLPPAAHAQSSQSTNNTEASVNAESHVTATQDLMNAAATWISSVPEGNTTDPRPTLAVILQQFPDNSYIPGESMFVDLFMLLARGFTIGDLMEIIRGGLEPLIRISSELRTFVVHRILQGDSTDSGYDRAVEKLLQEMQLFIDHLALLETRDNIDVVRSVQALLRARLPNIIALAISRNASSARLMFEQIRTTMQQLGALIVRASKNGANGVQTAFESFLLQFMEGIPQDLQQWSLQSVRPQFIEFINNVDVPESLLQRYIVRNIDPIIMPDAPIENHTSPPEPEPMQVEEIVESLPTVEQEMPASIHLSDDNDEALPTVVLGSAPWHAQVPSDWVPIIVRDTQRQRRQNSQPPFSDAYLSGMPSKRRKLADCNKPPSSISQVISESVRRAVTASGLATAAPVETVTQAAAADVNIQAAYRDLLHSSVQSELENNEDFTPEQFPNVDSYFNNRRQ